MRFWLMKSEPETYSWDRLVKERRTSWDGVRNHQANANMKAMGVGDQAFFYHSVTQKAVVGIVKISGLWHLDPKDAQKRFGMVEVEPVCALKNPVSLALIKETAALKGMIFVRQGRLSVSPVSPEEWRCILALSERART
ncbi:MAG: EVE domain-containing protein [Bdellovibrionales bacterium]